MRDIYRFNCLWNIRITFWPQGSITQFNSFLNGLVQFRKSQMTLRINLLKFCLMLE